MKAPCNRIIMMTGTFLFMVSALQMPISDADTGITLESAVRTALRENPELNAIREKVNVARARLEGIALLGNPELETEFVGGTHSEKVIELSKSFQLGGQRGKRRRIAKIKLDRVNFELDDASRLLARSVKLAFYDLALAQEKLKLAEQIIQHSEQMSNIAQARFEAGDISVTHVNLAKIQLQAARREMAALESGLRLTQLELNNLMGAALEAAPTAADVFSDKRSLTHFSTTCA